MIVQYFIDWDGIARYAHSRGRDGHDKLKECLCHLYALIRRNGCVAQNDFIRCRHVAIVGSFRPNNPDLANLIERASDIYAGYSLLIGDRADLNQSLKAWMSFFNEAGVCSFCGNDVRFQVIGEKSEKLGRNYVITGIGDVVSKEYDDDELISWRRMLHVTNRTRQKFERYFQSFVAASTEWIRIYDPYLSTAFLPCQCRDDENHKMWRNSFAYLCRQVLRNQYLKKLELITCRTQEVGEYLKDVNKNNKMLLGEIVQDILLRPGYLAGTNRHIELVLHLVRKDGNVGHCFHDRFIANERICFSIGHGCDICDVDAEFNRLVQKRTPVVSCQWRKIPNEFSFVPFNVFVGCTRQDGLKGTLPFAFENDRCKERKEEMAHYPEGCYSNAYETPEKIKEDFDLGYRLDKNTLTAQDSNGNEIRISINPRAEDGDW